MKLYNTLARKKEIMETITPGKVKMYVCGPTTYNYIHLGNARPIVVFDTIRRYIEYKGYNVMYIQNFTDIDDKIINKAKDEKIPPLELAKKYIQAYFKDADRLNVRRADIHPKVSDHIDDIILMVQKLIKKEQAYEVEGDVYFDVRHFKDYGKLSGRSLDELKAGARIQVDERKKDPLDFALWKKAKSGELSWSSPWGEGRPGWHIECSVMSLKYLGEHFDIHGGGHDLVFPHHENERAQSKACDCGFAKYWLHNGFITVNQEKMSKSLGNFFLVREILEKFSPDAVRFYLLATHYRSPLDFDDQKLVVATKSLEKIKNLKTALTELLDSPEEQKENETKEIFTIVDDLERKFSEAMDDDFNTALAIAALFDFTREMNSVINSASFILTSKTKVALRRADSALEQLGGTVLGLLFDIEGDTADNSNSSDGLVDDLMEILLQLRSDARQQKQWAIADKIRDSLKEKGIVVEDSPQGTKWKLV
ncbi:MAG: cysteine--tRNA ligase [Desulfitibacter sp. BRH_c19]|nr:MAG: cysteine--tRNA ligase [Desulfitibacter sp. BRH_c19]